MSASLYRKYRPQNFADVSGQKAAVDVITNSIAKSRVGHAYLFSGSRGCGKTSVARIFAKALNCLNPNGFEPCGHCNNCEAITAGESLDVIEIDGASNNGVDEVRGLKANVTLAPFSSKYKIYIIDEVHMLSTAAFNALLKTLEEPPEHVIFILATTEPHKVPVTIRSRCQHIPFHSISPEDIFERLNYVCKNENINFENEALWEISRQADGALRDALSLLEQVIAAGEVNLQNVERTFGAGSRTAFENWIKLFRSDMAGAYINLKNMFDSGASGIRIFEEMFALVRNLWLMSQWNDKNIVNSLASSEQEKNFLLEESQNWKSEQLHSLLNSILKILTQAKTGVKNDILLGMFMLFVSGEVDPFATIDVSLPLPRGDVRRTEGLVKTPPPQAVPLPFTRGGLTEATPQKEDLELKEKLLNLTNNDEYFLLHCGLYHSKPCLVDGDLILNMESEYAYGIFASALFAKQISKIFNEYKNIILKFNGKEFLCNKSEVQSENLQEVQNDIETKSPETQRQGYSFIEEFRQKLFQDAGIKTEIILVKPAETDENDEINNDDNDERNDD